MDIRDEIRLSKDDPLPKSSSDKPTNVVKDKVDVVKAPVAKEKDNADVVKNGGFIKADLNCSGGDGFVKQRGVKVPDTWKTWFNFSMSLEECEKVCLGNCNCTGYANSDVRSGGSGSLFWLDDLVDIRMYGEDGQDIYVTPDSFLLYATDRKAKAKRRVITIVILVVVGMTLILGLCLFYRRRKHKKNGTITVGRDNSYTNENKGGDWELPLFDFNIIGSATNNFSDSCKLGEGGYGPVYKGKLEDGKLIAVKRHSQKSKQGLDEFQNEVQCIAKLQHLPLVKLLGCCNEEDERMLIYEYMPNKSLNSFIFGVFLFILS
ncbi:G-type lectin S-receptor-like serine/threonine-protein kinase isoform X1 [Tanacetum coccineum]